MHPARSKREAKLPALLVLAPISRASSFMLRSALSSSESSSPATASENANSQRGPGRTAHEREVRVGIPSAASSSSLDSSPSAPASKPAGPAVRGDRVRTHDTRCCGACGSGAYVPWASRASRSSNRLWRLAAGGGERAGQSRQGRSHEAASGERQRGTHRGARAALPGTVGICCRPIGRRSRPASARSARRCAAGTGRSTARDLCATRKLALSQGRPSLAPAAGQARLACGLPLRAAPACSDWFGGRT